MKDGIHQLPTYDELSRAAFIMDAVLADVPVRIYGRHIGSSAQVYIPWR
jgi:hypothetical protein